MTLPVAPDLLGEADQTVIDTFFGLVPDMIVPVLGILALGIGIRFVTRHFYKATGKVAKG